MIEYFKDILKYVVVMPCQHEKSLSYFNHLMLNVACYCDNQV